MLVEHKIFNWPVWRNYRIQVSKKDLPEMISKQNGTQAGNTNIWQNRSRRFPLKFTRSNILNISISFNNINVK